MIEPNDERAAIERFRLDVWGYRALAVPGVPGALRVLRRKRSRSVDVVLAWISTLDARRLRNAMDPKAALIGATEVADELLARDISAEDLHEAIRRHARRRTGPAPRMGHQKPLPLRLIA